MYFKNKMKTYQTFDQNFTTTKFMSKQFCLHCVTGWYWFEKQNYSKEKKNDTVVLLYLSILEIVMPII